MSDMARELIEKPATSSEGTSDSKYKGVRKRKWGKWVSEIRLPNSRDRIWLGSYDSAEKAARAFDAAQFCLRGCNARFNFPDNPPDIAGGRSLTPPEIQLAASRFANSSAPEPPRRNGDDDQSASMCDLQTESPSPSLSISDGTAAMDCDLVDGPPFSDLLTGNMGSGNYASDYGLYPGYDDFCNDYFAPPLPGNNHQGFTGEDNFDGVLVQDSFLWNF